jgi:hypothetical protein
MNIAVREEEENLLLSFSSYSFLGFLRFSSLDFNKKSASTVNPRFRWDKVFFQIKGENFPNLT